MKERNTSPTIMSLSRMLLLSMLVVLGFSAKTPQDEEINAAFVREFGNVDVNEALIQITQAMKGMKSCEYEPEPRRFQDCIGNYGSSGKRTIHWVPKANQPGYCQNVTEIEECTVHVPISPLTQKAEPCLYSEWSKWSPCGTTNFLDKTTGIRLRVSELVQGPKEVCKDRVHTEFCDLTQGTTMTSLPSSLYRSTSSSSDPDNFSEPPSSCVAGVWMCGLSFVFSILVSISYCIFLISRSMNLSLFNEDRAPKSKDGFELMEQRRPNDSSDSETASMLKHPKPLSPHLRQLSWLNSDQRRQKRSSRRNEN